MQRPWISFSFSALAALAVVVGSLSGDEPVTDDPPGDRPPKVSQFAPFADLAAQLDYYLGRLSEALADGKDYDEAKQSRVAKDANTLAALALSLSIHDADAKYHGRALIQAAQQLADSADDFEKSAAALAEVKQAAANKGDNAAEMQWGKVASLEALMKQVPIVNNGLKRGLEPARFQRQATQSAGQAATLAAIAQAVLYDDEYADDPADAAEWRKLCQQMRDAAGAVNRAIHAGDAEAAQAAMKQLAQNCDACHEKFRGN